MIVLCIGNGYDIYCFVGDCFLILGGVIIVYYLGLDGYSDVDVLIYVLMDVFLGVLSLGDIGYYFFFSDVWW